MTTHLPVVADSLSVYLAEIKKIPLLSEENERELAIKLYEKKDVVAAHTLITANLRFVVKVAAEYRHYGLKLLDVIQEGNIGLMMAVKKYNPYKGIRLISYAVWWIRAYIQNYIISAWSLLKIGTTQAQRKLFFKLREAKEAIKKLGDDADVIQETARSLNVSEQEVVEMDARLQGEYSLDAEMLGSEGLTMLEMVPDERASQEEELIRHEGAQQLQKQVAAAVEKLNDKERFIVENRIIADQPMTLQEIASHFSISRERVRQIESNMLKKMKSSFSTWCMHA